MSMALTKLIDLSRESVNISMEKAIMTCTAFVYLVEAVGKMIFLVFDIDARLAAILSCSLSSSNARH